QQALLESRVLVIGAGGLGVPVLTYLASSGVGHRGKGHRGMGHLCVVDDDEIDLSNLPRQTLYRPSDVGQPKAQVVKQLLEQQNPDIDIQAEVRRADEAWLMQVLAEYDLLVDCTDNQTVRRAINRAAITHQRPWVSGSAIGMAGHVTSFDPRIEDVPCYACLYPNDIQNPQHCSESGVLAPITGIIGTLQALEAIKLLINQKVAGSNLPTLVGKLLNLDGQSSGFYPFKYTQNSQCQACRKA
ncbi:MAG: HesA/MoeB/ThiF family protein, partial [Oceanobacter sp.]